MNDYTRLRNSVLSEAEDYANRLFAPNAEDKYGNPAYRGAVAYKWNLFYFGEVERLFSGIYVPSPNNKLPQLPKCPAEPRRERLASHRSRKVEGIKEWAARLASNRASREDFWTDEDGETHQCNSQEWESLYNGYLRMLWRQNNILELGKEW